MNKISPWSDRGWMDNPVVPKSSPCCNATIDFSRGDGVSMGSCSKCNAVVARINPKTGKHQTPQNHMEVA